MANYCDRLARLDAQRDILKNPILAMVSKPDVIEFDSGGFHGKGLGMNRSDDMHGLIQQSKNALGRSQSALQHVVLLAEILDRPENARGVLEERYQDADGKCVVAHLPPTARKDRSYRQK